MPANEEIGSKPLAHCVVIVITRSTIAIIYYAYSQYDGFGL